jgi:hypothetical protein
MTEAAGGGWGGVHPAEPGDARFVIGMAERLAAVSRLAWLPAEATDRFAARGCQEAAAAIGQPGHVVLLAEDAGGEPLGFAHACLDESVFTGERSAMCPPLSLPRRRQGAASAGA